MLSHAPACGKIPRHALPSIRLAGEDWQRFLNIWEAIDSFDGDVTVEDFSAFYAQFRRLQRLSVPFDSSFIKRIEAIAHLCRFGEDDPDLDGFDELLTDRCDSDDESDFVDDEHRPAAFSRARLIQTCCQVANTKLMHGITLGLKSTLPPAPAASRSEIRFHVVTGRPIGQRPMIGANLIAIAKPARPS